MLHIYYQQGSIVGCINAVKGHLPIMLGTLKQRLDTGKPLYSFESTDVDANRVLAMLEAFDCFGVNVRFTEEWGGAEEEISREIFLNLLDSGRLIARQVEEDMEREAHDE